MIDTTLVAFAYGFLVFAAVAAAVAVAAIVVALRDRAAVTPVHVTVSGPSERAFSRAA